MHSALIMGAITGLAACSFSASGAGQDAISTTDSSVLDGRPVDARPDARSDAPPPQKRTTRGLVLRYDFNELADGQIVADVSGIGVPANLMVGPLPTNSVMPTTNGTSLTTTTANVLIDAPASDAGAKIAAACGAGALSIEIWMQQAPGQLAYGRLFSFGSSVDLGLRNVQVGTTRENGFANFLRSSASSVSGQQLDVVNAVDAAQRQLVVLRFGNGALKTDIYTGATQQTNSSALAGNFSTWSNLYKLVLLNSNRYFDSNDSRYWLGSIFSMSVYCAELTDTEIANDRLLGSESL
jgi:hypothetical protein